MNAIKLELNKNGVEVFKHILKLYPFNIGEQQSLMVSSSAYHNSQENKERIEALAETLAEIKANHQKFVEDFLRRNTTEIIIQHYEIEDILQVINNVRISAWEALNQAEKLSLNAEDIHYLENNVVNNSGIILEIILEKIYD